MDHWYCIVMLLFIVFMVGAAIGHRIGQEDQNE
jgi:hypothetical protein